MFRLLHPEKPGRVLGLLLVTGNSVLITVAHCREVVIDLDRVFVVSALQTGQTDRRQ